jgi:hypothetical protein
MKLRSAVRDLRPTVLSLSRTVPRRRIFNLASIVQSITVVLYKGSVRVNFCRQWARKVMISLNCRALGLVAALVAHGDDRRVAVHSVLPTT